MSMRLDRRGGKVLRYTRRHLIKLRKKAQKVETYATAARRKALAHAERRRLFG